LVHCCSADERFSKQHNFTFVCITFEKKKILLKGGFLTKQLFTFLKMLLVSLNLTFFYYYFASPLALHYIKVLLYKLLDCDLQKMLFYCSFLLFCFVFVGFEKYLGLSLLASFNTPVDAFRSLLEFSRNLSIEKIKASFLLLNQQKYFTCR